MSTTDSWQHFQASFVQFPTVGLAMDLSRLMLPQDLFNRMRPAFQRAFVAMTDLEHGAIANPDENRMVGHYWLRNADLAPKPELRDAIRNTVAEAKQFVSDVHAGRVRGEGGPFKYLLIIGIGGSALGPQFVADALGHPSTDRMQVEFFDNTDPDGMDKVLARLAGQLGHTLCLVISKSGGTKETRNGMLEAQAAYQAAGLDFSRHAVAITGVGSELDKQAAGWIRRFPMWDWVGGRTSETSVVGLLPAALQGLDIDELLRGARECDDLTRRADLERNPAALLALTWHQASGGRRDMVVLPYKDRLLLFSRYLQQLIMESLGKEMDINDNVVHQGLTVYGNKGSTDQHAYVQQLRDGVHNFFACFIEVLEDRATEPVLVEPDVTSGDYLTGFLLGTRQALFEKGRESITLTINRVSAFSVGVLIALFERAVGLYASLININAYHQPGVEAGKKAAGRVIEVQRSVLAFLRKEQGRGATVDEIASGLNLMSERETIFKVCEHVAANRRGLTAEPGATVFTTRYRV